MSKYLYAVALIISVTGCQSSAKAGGGAGSSSSAGATTPSTSGTSSSSSASSPSSPSGSASVSPTVPLLPPTGVLTRVAELSTSGGFVGTNALAVPTVAVYSDGTVVLAGQKRLTLTPGALDMLVSTLQDDLKSQPATTVLLPKGGHANPDESATVVGVYQPGGKYQTVSALGLNTGTASQYPAPVADAFAKVQALTTDAATPYTTTKVRYVLQCSPQENSPQKPWPTGLPQPARSQPVNCSEAHNADGAVAAAVRAACTDTNTRQPQPAVTVYGSASGARICRWRYALPDETS
ncbi:hypothetical protein Caci_1186 [Catenulispora acidiphila DSM 44928]|uniref:Lipoprotein n=1 Tax=Catenulispora acidiphila (strain DSM 44928 / JCM 14897 / NBRC 102108 / NRRL B-24433 / ID139908) TaxID=479433 RepID=C7Q614_CATAD|nr:hypothetical protein [Catenulispora acidiphila]ACU70111.1 hypothetical protein Caci_1186 [Catenulispora acidiphila DSM 44928]